MTDAALGGRALEPPPFHPPWLRPAAIAVVVALHAAALSFLPVLAPKPPETPREVIVDIEPEAPPPEAPAAPSAEAPKAPEAPPAAVLPPPAQAVQPPPPPPIEPPPPEPAPPVVEAPPAVSISPPPPPEAPPVVEAPPPPAPVELTPPKPSPPPPRVEPANPQVKPPPKLEPRQPELRQPRAHQARAKAEPAPKRAAETAGPASAAPAASQSAYISAMAAAIRGHLFYPPAARARGAKGVVGVAFTIGSSGALVSFVITHSSGDEDLDAAARTLVQSVRFPPPPSGSAHVATSFNYVPR